MRNAGARRGAIGRGLACARIVLALTGTGAASAFAAAPASEAFGAVQLRWDAPESCPSAAQVRELVARDQAAPIEDVPLAILLDARIDARADGRYGLRVRTTSATGSSDRTWIADTCDDAAELTVVLVSSAIERAKTGEDPPLDASTIVAPPSAPPAEPDSGPASAPKVSTAPATTDDARPSTTDDAPAASTRRGIPTIAVRPSLGIEIATLPRVGFATSAALVLRWRFVRLETFGFYATPRATVRDDSPGAVVQLLTIGARGCGRVNTRFIEIPLCAGAEIGAVFGRGVGVTDTRRDRVLWGGILLGPALVVRAHERVGIMLDGHAVFPLGRPTFSLAPAGTVWTGTIGGRILLGVEVRLR